MCFAMLLTVLSSCKPGNSNIDTESNSESNSDTPKDSETEAPPSDPTYVFKDGKTDYVIIYGADTHADAEERTFALRLKEEFKSYGIDIDCHVDMTSWEDKPDSSVKEILIGHTNRPETETVLSKLKYSDYAIVEEGNKIVVASNSTDGINRATNYFINRIMPEAVKEGDKYVSLELGDGFTFNADYTVDTLKIDGVELTNYRIVYPYGERAYFEKASNTWREVIAEKYGYMLEIVTDKEEATEYEILIGTTNRPESTAAFDAVPMISIPMKYDISVKNKKLVVHCGGAYTAENSITELATKVFTKKEVSLTEGYKFEGTLMTAKQPALTEGADVRIMSANIMAEMATWQVSQVAVPIPPRVEIFVANLLYYMPDAIGIQEATSNWIRYLKIYLEGTPYELLGYKRPDGGDNYSSLIYNAEKFDVEAEGFKTYTKNSTPVCRNIKWAIFKSKTNDVCFGLISTHWDAGYEPEKVEMRTTQLYELIDMVNKLEAKYGCTIMTTGDYNASELSPSYKEFMEKSNMYNSKLEAEKLYNNVGSTRIFGSAAVGAYSIDFVFTTKDSVKVLGFMTVNGNHTHNLSDHNPVFADIAVKK